MHTQHYGLLIAGTWHKRRFGVSFDRLLVCVCVCLSFVAQCSLYHILYYGAFDFYFVTHNSLSSFL